MDFQHVVICCDVWSIHLCLIFSSWSWGMEAGTGWSPWNSGRKRLGSHGPQCSCEVGNSWDSFQWFPQPVFLTFIIIYIHAQSIPVHHVHFATFDHRKPGKTGLSEVSGWTFKDRQWDSRSVRWSLIISEVVESLDERWEGSESSQHEVGQGLQELLTAVFSNDNTSNIWFINIHHWTYFVVRLEKMACTWVFFAGLSIKCVKSVVQCFHSTCHVHVLWRYPGTSLQDSAYYSAQLCSPRTCRKRPWSWTKAANLRMGLSLGCFMVRTTLWIALDNIVVT